MNKITSFFVFMLISVCGNSQDTAYKRYSDSTGAYLIEYRHSGFGFTPLTYPVGEPHYFATIQVYSLPDTIMIGEPFSGTYVKNGCFEDDPATWIVVARKSQEAKKPKE